MATVSEALFSAVVGLAGGLVGAATLERLKANVASLDVELVRLDALEDDLFDVFELPADHKDYGAMLRQITGRRRRLGQNLRRKVADSVAYEACKNELVKLDGYIGKAEDGVPLTSELEAEIETTVRQLSRHLRRSSRAARAFALLRGDV